MYKMKRYQVYLNPQSVSIVDELAKHINIPKSKLIRESIDRLAEQATKIFVATKTQSKKKYILDSLAGSISINGKKRTNYASRVDDIYLQD